jgi:hypothetical protein
MWLEMTARQSSSSVNKVASHLAETAAGRDQVMSSRAEAAASRFWTASRGGRLGVRHGDFEAADEWASLLFKDGADAVVGRRAQQAAIEIWAAIEAEKGRVGADLLRATPS